MLYNNGNAVALSVVLPKELVVSKLVEGFVAKHFVVFKLLDGAVKVIGVHNCKG